MFESHQIRYHPADDAIGLPKAEVPGYEVSVVIRPDGSVDVYGAVAVVDQRPLLIPRAK